MKISFLNLLFILVISSCTTKTSIKVNSLGYKPDDAKYASITQPSETTFSIIDHQTQKTVFKDEISLTIFQNDINEKVARINFSDLNQPGNYYIKVGDVASPVFTISNDVFKKPLYTSMRAFYLWRCGEAVEGEYDGQTYTHAECHTDDGYTAYEEDNEQKKDGVGGWHDAGDYGKYTVNAGVTVGSLFLAWEHFNDKLSALNLHLPENSVNAKFPDFLKEIKYEIDWLFKMQYNDGSGRVSHKLTRKFFSGFIMPETDNEKRYFTTWSSAATADFVAMMAMASRNLRPFDELYADSCLAAAKVSYQCLLKNPEHVKFEQGDFSTGGYQTNDEDDRLWAAAEMWLATGDQLYLNDLEQRLSVLDNLVELNWDWGNVGNLGVFGYVLHPTETQNQDLYLKAKASVLSVADTIVKNTQQDVYGRSFDKYFWGCNGTVARHSINLGVANLLQPDKKYAEASVSIVSHLFGCNYYGRSYITGLGINPPMYPHSRRSAADSVDAPWPGYIVGGGHTAIDWVDKEESYSHNEIAINWQAGLVYLLSSVY
ncbi:glycoside hydrolase family 9 protein [Carboxylicivirga caseinilyticus]|uniref:glycoside hydrolase family 9 protein n=1 Tax=Carboxylicivirga caseinilyticus TaxID=3417572 RepID=UPI003D359622|nr:glycoside hydrolase family 9 protein [Marinilabiliaceae bacterium A049]